MKTYFNLLSTLIEIDYVNFLNIKFYLIKKCISSPINVTEHSSYETQF